MSMNLKVTNSDINLWQTPTWITYMCLSYNDKGKPDGGMEGVRRRYIMWVKSHMDGKWENERDLREMQCRVKLHVEEVLALKRPQFDFI